MEPWTQGLSDSRTIERIGTLVARIAQLTAYKKLQQQKTILESQGVDFEIDSSSAAPQNVKRMEPTKQNLVEIYTKEGSSF